MTIKIPPLKQQMRIRNTVFAYDFESIGPTRARSYPEVSKRLSCKNRRSSK
ncbi:hypothetical protein MADA3029_390006 [Vibrio nigripulchritudo MADA3029]|nr:hypothetical protein MADA3029_390006 [Vibrio nigripulchritudo MADA3029]